MPETPRYIAVEGPIGVGKTTLAQRLALSFGSELVLEQPEDNPFLERFYDDPRGAALPTQLFFLFQRARQLLDMQQGDMFAPVRVADFIMEKDRLFAELTLDADELRLYEQVFAQLAVSGPVPDLVVYLQAPVDVLIERIARRGIAYEQSVGRDYLERLNEAYARFFHNYVEAPTLIVNAAAVDFVGNDEHYRRLLEQIRTIRSGRHYFNVAGSLT